MTDFDPRSRVEFEKRYEAQIITSQRRYRRAKRVTLADIQAWYAHAAGGVPVVAPPSTEIEDVEMIEIVLPKDKLPDLLHSQDMHLYMKEREERKLREEYPALQSAWEKYQTILMMVK
jgi:hypothetical protein